MSEPERIGVPTSKPNSASLRPSFCLMPIPIMEKIVQTAKQTVKAAVLAIRARFCPWAAAVSISDKSALPFLADAGASPLGAVKGGAWLSVLDPNQEK